MKNKPFAILLIFLLTIGTVGAQVRKKGNSSAAKTVTPVKATVNPVQSKSKFSNTGDRFFVREEYFKAAEEYLNGYNADNTDAYAAFMLAESYRLYFDYTSAEKYYGIVKNGPNAKTYGLSGYWYASMLKINGKYADAETAFREFAANFTPTIPANRIFKDQANVEAAGCSLAVAEGKKKFPDYKYIVLPKGVNTEYSDYAAAPYQNDSMIVFTSARPGRSRNINDPRTGARFSDLYSFGKKNNEWTETPSDELKAFNTRLNDGAGTFNKDHTKYYFTSCGAGVPCQIMLSEYAGGHWSNPKPLNNLVNMPGFASKQPTVTLSGDTMFFVSDRPGGIGLTDIWMTFKRGAGENWIRPMNMGRNINSPYQEVSPYLGPESLLFFSSNGREGLGGLDIFMAENKGSGKVTNLGLPFNSNRDDFCFIIGKRLGYLSSNRDGGQGNDDIYAFDIYNADPSVKNAIINKEEIANRAPKPVETPLAVVKDSGSVDITGTVKTDSGKTQEGVTIAIKDKDGKTTGTTQTGPTGEFHITNAPHGTHPVIAHGPKPHGPKNHGHKPTEQPLKLADVSIIKTPKKVARFLFENIYFDFDGDSLRPEAKKTMDELIAYSNENTHIQLELNANTDNLGDASYNKELSARRAEAAKNYLLSHGLHKNSLVVRALGEGRPIAGNTNPAGRTLNRRVEFFIRGGQAYTAGAMAYVPETDDKFSNIANQFGMTTDEILTLNATTDENVKAYTSVRVKRKLAGRFVAPVTMALTKTPRPDLLPELEGRPAVKKHPKKGKK